MQISNEDKKQILIGFIGIFNRISNKEYQKRIWIKGKGPEVDDFDDTVCDFCGECDSILEHYKSFGITDDQYHLLVKFQGVFETFIDEHRSYLPEEFIETEAWNKVVELAKDVLQAFNWPI